VHAFRGVVEITDEFRTLAYINIGDINIGGKMRSDLFSAAIPQRSCIRPRECSNAGMRCMPCSGRLTLAKLLHMTGEHYGYAKCPDNEPHGVYEHIDVSYRLIGI